MSQATVEVLICTLGTRGDILPFLALGVTLKKLGYAVTILTNSNWKSLVTSIGADFFEIADEDPPQDGRNNYEFFVSNTFGSFARSFSIIERKCKENPRCVLVYRLNMVGAECAADKFRLPHVKVALQPAAIRSTERPPWPIIGITKRRGGKLLKKTVVPLLFCFSEFKYRRITNTFRKSVQVPAIPLFGSVTGSEDLFLLLCPEWFSNPQRDWPNNTRSVGFLFFDRPSSNLELDHFLSENGAPIVFTPGTGIKDVSTFFSLACDVGRKLGLPVIFLSRNARRAGLPTFNRTLVMDEADLAGLLPRSKVLVHHGGIGTTAQAIRAGIPQCILPRGFDQPDNAVRTAMLGLGAVVLSKSPSSEEVASAVRAILECDALTKQILTASRLVRNDDALGKAGAAIDKVARSRFLTP